MNSLLGAAGLAEHTLGLQSLLLATGLTLHIVGIAGTTSIGTIVGNIEEEPHKCEMLYVRCASQCSIRACWLMRLWLWLAVFLAVWSGDTAAFGLMLCRAAGLHCTTRSLCRCFSLLVVASIDFQGLLSTLHHRLLCLCSLLLPLFAPKMTQSERMDLLADFVRQPSTLADLRQRPGSTVREKLRRKDPTELSWYQFLQRTALDKIRSRRLHRLSYNIFYK